jgi:hypothetical protein
MYKTQQYWLQLRYNSGILVWRGEVASQFFFILRRFRPLKQVRQIIYLHWSKLAAKYCFRYCRINRTTKLADFLL